MIKITKHTLLFLLTFSISISLFSQNSQTDTLKIRIKKCADEGFNALLSKDYETFIKYMDPHTIEVVGGKEKVYEFLKKEIPGGGEIKSIENSLPSDTILANNKIQCTVEGVIKILVKDGTLITKSTVIGISEDEGKNWYFIEASRPLTELQIDYPFLSDRLKIEPWTPPILSHETSEFDYLLAKGKAEFKKEFNDQDFNISVKHLEKCVLLKPENVEAHYFLGYAYSELNLSEGNGILGLKLPLTLKSSKEFEIVNKLTSKYQGEIVVFDPYTKLTIEWGLLAMSYCFKNKTDSTIWAFNEGKKRGGFGDFFVLTNKKTLDLTSPNSILVSSGENISIPLWYLQIVEGYRKDVSIVDINLLNSTWYPSYLSNNGIVQFDLSSTELDTIPYCIWKDSLITINNFTWTVRPSYYEQYINRGDRIFLSLLKENKFKKDLYFTTGVPKELKLSLEKYTSHEILVDKFDSINQLGYDFNKYKSEVLKLFSIFRHVNMNSRQELVYIDHIRFDILNRIKQELDNGNKENAKELFKLLDKNANNKKYPYQDERLKKYIEDNRGKSW